MDVVDDPSVEVRWEVAHRTRDGAVLTRLAGDEDWTVLAEVWRNEACPPVVLGVLGLALLVTEADDDLRDLLAHPQCPQWLRVRVATAYPAWDV